MGNYSLVIRGEYLNCTLNSRVKAECDFPTRCLRGRKGIPYLPSGAPSTRKIGFHTFDLLLSHPPILSTGDHLSGVHIEHRLFPVALPDATGGCFSYLARTSTPPRFLPYVPQGVVG